jgi:hypothetical protein
LLIPVTSWDHTLMDSAPASPAVKKR